MTLFAAWAQASSAAVQVGSPPSTLQVPATPPAASPTPLRHTSQSPVRQDSPDTGRRPSTLNLRQVGSASVCEAVCQHRAPVVFGTVWDLAAMRPDPLKDVRGDRAYDELTQRPRVPDPAAQALSQPNPGPDDALGEAAMHAQAALHQTGALPAMGAVRILLPHLGHFHHATHFYHTPPTV